MAGQMMSLIGACLPVSLRDCKAGGGQGTLKGDVDDDEQREESPPSRFQVVKRLAGWQVGSSHSPSALGYLLMIRRLTTSRLHKWWPAHTSSRWDDTQPYTRLDRAERRRQPHTKGPVYTTCLGSAALLPQQSWHGPFVISQS